MAGKMKKTIHALVAFATLSVGGMASATTITFDDINAAVGGFGLVTLPSPYDGLNWSCPSGCLVMDVAVYSSSFASGYENSVVSPPNVLATSGFTFSPAAGGTFSFDSTYITAAWRNDMSVAVVGYSGSTVVDTTTLTLGAAGIQGFFTFDWNNLTSVSITPSGGTASTIYTAANGVEIGVDNLTVSGSPVPLPAAFPLLLSGLAGLGAFGRRKFAA